MTERSILFKGQMVRAILEGRKTQTRRIVSLPDYVESKDPNDWDVGLCFNGTCQFQNGPSKHRSPLSFSLNCPNGEPGNRLWVRETCWIWGLWYKNGRTATGRQKWTFKADTPHAVHFNPEHRQNAVPGKTPRERRVYWKRPSIFMPRWACRLVLEVKAVRVERLQDISEDDAEAEGVRGNAGGEWGREGLLEDFETLWDSINAKRGHGWDTNPWVWVVEFSVVEDMQK